MDKSFFKNQMKRLITELASINMKKMAKIEREAYKSDLEDLFEKFNTMTRDFARHYKNYL